MKPSNNILSLLPKNVGTHNSIYRGEDITELFYNGTLSKQISVGTFDDIFIGDYIIGKESQRKYLVADLDYRFNMGDTKCTTHHVLMIPEKSLGFEKMNTENVSTDGYLNSDLYKNNLERCRTIIKNDFETSHILTHRNFFANKTSTGAGAIETSSEWVDSDIDLMNEIMVYGSNIYHNLGNTLDLNAQRTIDNTQLSLFRLYKTLLPKGAWLRDVANQNAFCFINSQGLAQFSYAANQGDIYPAFLIY